MNLHQLYLKQVEAWKERFGETNQNPVVRLDGVWYNQLITSAVLEHGVVVWRTLTRAFLQLYRFESPILGDTHFTLSGFLLRIKRGANILMGCVGVLYNRVAPTIPLILLNNELNLGFFYIHVFNEPSHSVCIHYSNLTKISQNCVVKSQEMVATLSHKIGTTLSYRVYATLNRATLLTRSGVMSG